MSERPAWLLVVVKEKEEEEQEMGVGSDCVLHMPTAMGGTV